MRIVILGLSLSSSWGNGHATTYRSLVKGLSLNGHRVTFLERDVPWYADNRDMPQFEHCDLQFYDSLDGLTEGFAEDVRSADVVMLGSYVPEGPEVLDWLLQEVHGTLCFYDIDTPVTLEALAQDQCEYLRRDQVGCFDCYFSFAGGASLARLAELGARHPRPLYCSVDTDLYRPLPGQADAGRHWRLGYMGTYSDDRQPVVEALLLEVARRRRDARFVIGGPGFPDPQAWPDNVTWLPHVPPAEHRAFYGRQDFTLNATRAAMVALGHSPSVRLFEAAACGSCIISDAWPGLEEVLVPGQEIFIARSTDDVLEIIDGVSAEERAAVGRAARQRMLDEHSHLQRAAYLVECLNEVREADRVTS